MSQNDLWLRIIQVNDVYELDNFPSFKTLVDEKRNGPSVVIVVMAGDFLGPSLLSSLDKGRGIVDVMNQCGFSHVCIGNHETDVPINAIAPRIMQSNFVWLNTNMRQLDDKLDIETKAHDVVIVSNGKFSKKVGLLGLLTEDPGLYRPGAFGGASIEPVMDATEVYLKNGLPQDLDLIIPLTHQRIAEDRTFANKFGGDVFPIIIGGHDHEIYDEIHNGSRIIKTGHDAIHTAIIDIMWDSSEDDVVAEKPLIHVEMIPTHTFQGSPDIEDIVSSHKRIIQELESAKIFRFDDWVLHKDPDQVAFSTVDNRLGDSSGSTILCTLFRMAMRASVGIVNAGCIRGNTTYPMEQKWFTWSDLKGEIPFSTELVAVEIPGKVIEDVITESRRGVREQPPVARGGYIHHCDQIQYDNENCKIVTICGEPFEPNKMYLTALPGQFFEGIDNHAPLLEWAKEQNLKIDNESGKPAKLALIEMFAALMWLEMGSFGDIDTDDDGVITYLEVKARAAQVFGDCIADIVVESVMDVADLTGDGTISPIEMMVARFVATDMLDHVATHEELSTMSLVASEVLGKRPSHDDVNRVVHDLKNVLDSDGTGNITRDEAMRVLGEVKRRSLLI